MMTQICQILIGASGDADKLALFLRLRSCLTRRRGFFSANLSSTIAILLVFLMQKELFVLAIFLQFLCQRYNLHFLLFK